MSRNFYTIFSKNFKKIFNDYKRNDSNLDDLIVSSKLYVGLVISSIHCFYARGTMVLDKTKIVEKYKMVRNGNSDFMVIDDRGRHFNVNNSLWYWKWNSIEEWHNIKEGSELFITYYGWRIAFLGLFPNIVNYEYKLKNIEYNVESKSNKIYMSFGSI